MGPWNEQVQLRRSKSIQTLLDTNPQLDEGVHGMWKRKLNDLAVNEDEYNCRVVELYKNIKTDWLTDVS